MADIFQEVDEALEREKLLKLWKEYRPVIIGGIAGLILGVAFWSGLKNWTYRQNAEQTTLLIESMDSDDQRTALLKTAENTRPGHRTLALMIAAGNAMAFAQGDPEEAREAAEIYSQISADKKAPDLYREFAQVMAIRANMLAAPPENADPQTVETWLPDLTAMASGEDKSPWWGQALLTAAEINAFYKKDFAAARSNAEQVASAAAELPPTLAERARTMAHVFAVKAADAPSNE